jgi:hypothetical protein
VDWNRDHCYRGHYWPTVQPWIIDDGEYGAIDGMIGREAGVLGEKLASVPLCPPQIPHDLTRARTLAAAMGSRRLT